MSSSSKQIDLGQEKYAKKWDTKVKPKYKQVKQSYGYKNESAC